MPMAPKSGSSGFQQRQKTNTPRSSTTLQKYEDLLSDSSQKHCKHCRRRQQKEKDDGLAHHAPTESQKMVFEQPHNHELTLTDSNY